MSQCWLWTTKYRLGYPKRILVSNVNVNKTIFKLIYYSLFAGWIMINSKILWPWNYLSIFPFFIFFFFDFEDFVLSALFPTLLTHFQSMSHYCTKYLKHLWTLMPKVIKIIKKCTKKTVGKLMILLLLELDNFSLK